GIRHRDLGPARTVGHGPRVRSGALGSDSKRTSRVNPRKAPSPRAHGLDIDDRDRNREGVDHGIGRPSWLALREGGKVRAGPSHVEGDEILPVTPSRQGGRGGDAAGGTAEDQVNGSSGDGRLDGYAASRLHHEEVLSN